MTDELRLGTLGGPLQGGPSIPLGEPLQGGPSIPLGGAAFQAGPSVPLGDPLPGGEPAILDSGIAFPI